MVLGTRKSKEQNFHLQYEITKKEKQVTSHHNYGVLLPLQTTCNILFNYTIKAIGQTYHFRYSPVLVRSNNEML